jgi:hypothetical protein
MQDARTDSTGRPGRAGGRTVLATETDVLRTLAHGTYTLGQLYAICAERCDVSRDGGGEEVPGHRGDLRWRHRLRGGLQTMRRHGLADRIGQTAWAIRGTATAPTRLLLIVAGATPAEFELRLQEAVELLAELDEPADLVLCDPPYGLGRGEGLHYADGNGYRRDDSQIAGGYVDVEPARYAEFTRTWVQAATAALRGGGQLAVFTGPQRAAIVQCAAEDAGLRWVSSIAAGRQFPIATQRHPSPAHWVLTIMVHGCPHAPAPRLQRASRPAGGAQRRGLPAGCVARALQRPAGQARSVPLRQQLAGAPGAAGGPHADRSARTGGRPLCRRRNHRGCLLAVRPSLHRR